MLISLWKKKAKCPGPLSNICNLRSYVERPWIFCELDTFMGQEIWNIRQVCTNREKLLETIKVNENCNSLIKKDFS